MSTLEMILWAFLVVLTIGLLLFTIFMNRSPRALRPGAGDDQSPFDPDERKPGDGF